MSQKHDIPEHLIPSEDTVLAASEEEIGLNESLDTPKWVYAEEPDDGRCPYCGKEYLSATSASQVVSKGVCPYPVEEHGDFIISFVHEKSTRKPVAWDSNGNVTMWTGGDPRTFCSPEHEDTLVRYPCSVDYSLKNV
jgi:hypothetical protein